MNLCRSLARSLATCGEPLERGRLYAREIAPCLQVFIRGLLHGSYLLLEPSSTLCRTAGLRVGGGEGVRPMAKPLPQACARASALCSSSASPFASRPSSILEALLLALHPQLSLSQSIDSLPTGLLSPLCSPLVHHSTAARGMSSHCSHPEELLIYLQNKVSLFKLKFFLSNLLLSVFSESRMLFGGCFFNLTGVCLMGELDHGCLL